MNQILENTFTLVDGSQIHTSMLSGRTGIKVRSTPASPPVVSPTLKVTPLGTNRIFVETGSALAAVEETSL